ncbi:Probable cytoplasmic aconitate hydratase [Eumeta japonica]|uniref:Probable cytoplasmic aconitate hydratase n=1 Tax=Eumeta variegata TaxID=151549 RepID=A0A4C1WMC7_EUMVA|nr:Probable cytoplasmic aconitate hydratase [Eumeta japonica]
MTEPSMSKCNRRLPVFLLKWHLEVGFKGYGLTPAQLDARGSFTFSDGGEYTITHGSVIIAAITSCTNTSNPSVMLGAGEWAQRW